MNKTYFKKARLERNKKQLETACDLLLKVAHDLKNEETLRKEATLLIQILNDGHFPMCTKLKLLLESIDKKEILEGERE